MIMEFAGIFEFAVVGNVPWVKYINPPVGPVVAKTPALPAVPLPPVPAVPSVNRNPPPFELAPLPREAPPLPAVRLIDPPAPPTAFVPVPAPPAPAASVGELPMPAVPAALLVAPPITPETLNTLLALVPVVVLTEAGAVPAMVSPVVDVPM